MLVNLLFGQVSVEVWVEVVVCANSTSKARRIPTTLHKERHVTRVVAVELCQLCVAHATLPSCTQHFRCLLA